MSSIPDGAAFSIRRAEWPRDLDALRGLRRRVFIEEQSVPEALEWDGADEDAVHLLAMDAAGEPIGTARLLPSGQIGRMAVLAHWRRRGVGRALLDAILRIAGEPGRPVPFLNAQTSAIEFYRHAGFVPEGEEFDEAGIPHRRMVAGRSDGPVLGVTKGEILLRDRAAARDASLRMAAQVRRGLCILSRDLDPFLYDDADFLASVRHLVLQVQRLAVRVLAFDPGPAVRHGHRLIELARRHSSHVEIRRVPPEHSQHVEAFLLADDRGYVRRPIADAWEGTADFNDPLTVRRLGADFENLWEVSERDPELRRLFI